MQYKKIFKWLLVCLFIVGIITAAYGFINNWPEDKVWKNSKSLVSKLPGEIKYLKDTLGVELLTKSELKEKAIEIELMNNVGKDCSAKAKVLTDEIENAKASKSKQKRLIAQYQPTLDSLTAVMEGIKAMKETYEQEKELEDKVATYNKAKDYIANGDASVNTILYGTYFMVVIAILALFTVIFIITGLNNPKSLVSILIGVIVIAALVIGAWMMAPGTPIHGPEYYQALGPDAKVPSEGDLKLTDAVLYLTYLLVGATVVSLVTSWIVGAIRK